MKDNKIIDKMTEHPAVKSIGLSRDNIVSILNACNDIASDTLLENGHLELSNGLIIEVVPLLNRVHVLRGTTYRSSRKYKLKLTMEEKLYKKIENYYDRLREDIL